MKRAGIAVVLVIGLIGAAVVYQDRYGTWADLREAEDRFGTPVGFSLLERREEGTALCVITCNGARIRLVFESDAPLDAACESALRAAARLTDRVGGGVTGPTSCAARGDMAGAGKRAGFGLDLDEAGAITVDRIQEDWVRAVAGTADGAFILVVVLDSGLN